MSHKIKKFIIGLFVVVILVVIAQSCSKEILVPEVTSEMRLRAIDFKNAIETRGDLLNRSSVYIYQSITIKKYINNPQDLVAKLTMLGFTDVYIAYDKPSRFPHIPKRWYLKFNKLAHKNGIQIHALSLSNLRLYVSDEPIKYALEEIKEFNNSVSAIHRFDGISADLEPHLLKINSIHRPKGLTLAWQQNDVIGGDNDLLLKRTVEVMALAKKEMGSLKLNQALGFFFQHPYDTGLLSWGSAHQFLQHCDHVVVMAYNYRAKRVVEMATPVLRAAKDYPQSVSIAVNTSLNTVGDEGPLTSLQPQGWDNLITSLEYILLEAKTFRSFRGIDVFEFGGLEIMWESK